MTWLRIDDGFPDHPKIVGLSDAAFRLHVSGMAYCSRHLTDGLIPEGALRSLYPRNPKRAANELVIAGDWHVEGHACATCPDAPPRSFLVHDFLVYNPSADEAEEARERRSDKARRAARARWDHSGRDAPEHPPSIARASAAPMLPDAPSRPVPSPARSSSSSNGTGVAPAGVDDDELEASGTPTDERRARRRSVLERTADQKIGDRRLDNPRAYRARVLEDVEREHGGRLDSLLERYRDDAPLESFVGELLGEPNSLHLYRRPPIQETA